MKIVVVSDSHGHNDRVRKVLELYPDADYYIHCGDVEDGPIEPFLYVSGNNDYSDIYPDSRIVSTSVANIFVTHGHLFSYRNKQVEMAAAAKKENCSIVCYGHTHMPYDRIVDGIHLINPGSLYYNRDGSDPCFCILNIDEEGSVKVEFHTFPLEKKQRKFLFM